SIPHDREIDEKMSFSAMHVILGRLHDQYAEPAGLPLRFYTHCCPHARRGRTLNSKTTVLGRCLSCAASRPRAFIKTMLKLTRNIARYIALVGSGGCLEDTKMARHIV